VNLDPTETQRLLQEGLTALLRAEVPFDRIRTLERTGDWDRKLWSALAEQGWLGLPFGGGGAGAVVEGDDEHGGLVDLGLAVECLARRAAIVPILEVAVAGRTLAAAGEEALVEGVVAGDVVPVPAILEASDCFDAVALAVDDAGRLTGEKRFVDYGQHATHHLVAARMDGAPALLCVDARGPEVRCEPLRHIGRTPSCVVHYEGAPARRVGDAGALETVILLGRALAAVQCVGAMAEALDATVRYARVREQFGKPIGSFQAVRHHCADMASRVASARQMAFEALSELASGHADPVRVAAAKAAASRAAPEVLMLAHQIHGGNGVIEENDLYFFTLRGKERSLAWGSVEECLDVVARRVDQPVDWL
jgi:alkylation response protein AidB-like acyl-CoA dehydrogenase